ncbi:MAG: hypothetical protein KC503_17695 [Myxococcales bacterium]|nr:hypothetical protein [Myxococcales bacterium]
MSTFDMFIALDGHGLNGFEGFAGVARLRADTERDHYDVRVKFFDGIAGGHATQINPQGTLAYLGNLSQTLLLYDPRTLEEVARLSTLRFAAPDVVYSSQTHVAWLGERTFVTVIGPDFYRFEVDDLENPTRLGPHCVTLPHALKRSPSGRYLFYGAMDHDKKGYANQVGIYDLETDQARVVALPATAWHLGLHPSKDIFYAPTQRCSPQGDMEFAEYTMAHYKNYLFEIDGPSAKVLRHAAIPKDLPGFLTSDVIVTDDEVLYNCCASSVIARIDLATLSHVRYIDERVGALSSMRYLRSGLSNLAESLSRVNLPDALHTFAKSLRITRGSLLDGSYGLQLSPDKTRLLSAHRGRNQVIVYSYPDCRVLRRVDFPPLRRFFPEHLGLLDDTRLGFHHSAMSCATVA